MNASVSFRSRHRSATQALRANEYMHQCTLGAVLYRVKSARPQSGRIGGADYGGALGWKIHVGEYVGLSLVEQAGALGRARAHLPGTVLVPRAARKAQPRLIFKGIWHIHYGIYKED